MCTIAVIKRRRLKFWALFRWCDYGALVLTLTLFVKWFCQMVVILTKNVFKSIGSMELLEKTAVNICRWMDTVTTIGLCLAHGKHTRSYAWCVNKIVKNWKKEKPSFPTSQDNEMSSTNSYFKEFNFIVLGVPVKNVVSFFFSKIYIPIAFRIDRKCLAETIGNALLSDSKWFCQIDFFS